MARCKRCEEEVPSVSWRGVCEDCARRESAYREHNAALDASQGLITKGLLAANVIVFGMMAASGVNVMDPKSADVLRWGGDFGPLTLGPQPWRLAACMFIHIGVIHLLFNMWCLWDLGRLAESLFGRRSFLLIYLASGVCGTYLSLLWNPLRLSAGASGAIFGIAGALIAGFKLGDLPLDPDQIRATLRSVVLFAAYNLFFGLAGSINNMAHLGGLAGGFAIGFLLTRFFPPHSARYRASVTVLAVVIGAALAGGYFGLRTLKADQIAYGQAGLAASEDDCGSGIQALERVVKSHPNDAEAHAQLGYCYERNGRDDDAIREFQAATAIDPKDAYSAEQLGWLYLQKKESAKSEEAFRRAAALEPEDSETQRGLAVALADNGKPAEALKAAETAVKLAPKDVKALFALDYVYRRAGRTQDAIRTLRQILELEPANADAHRELAELLEKTGDKKGAEQERRALNEAGQKKP